MLWNLAGAILLTVYSNSIPMGWWIALTLLNVTLTAINSYSMIKTIKKW